MFVKTAFIKDIAEQITMDQFHELVARVCIREAKLSHDKTIDVAETARWLFYTGMPSEPDISNEIDALIREEH